MKVVFKELKEDYKKQIIETVKEVLHKYYKIDDCKLIYDDNRVYIENNSVYISIAKTDKYLLMAFDKVPLGVSIINDRKDKETAIHNAIVSLDLNKYSIKTKIIGNNTICIAKYKT